MNQSNIPGNRFNFSAKHEAMFKYVSKILFSIWKLPCVTKEMTSSLSSNDCNELLDDLNAIKNLFDANSINDLSCKYDFFFLFMNFKKFLESSLKF